MAPTWLMCSEKRPIRSRSFENCDGYSDQRGDSSSESTAWTLTSSPSVRSERALRLRGSSSSAGAAHRLCILLASARGRRRLRLPRLPRSYLCAHAIFLRLDLRRRGGAEVFNLEHRPD